MYGGASVQNWLGPMMLLLICGLIVGLALIGSDLINPISSWVESQRYQAETQQLIERNTMLAEQESKLLEAQAKAEIERLEAEAIQREQLHELEIQQLKGELQRANETHQEEMRQAQEMAAVKFSLLNTAGIILAVSFGISLIILSFAAIRHLPGNPPHPPRLLQADLRPYRPSSQTPQTASHPHRIHTGNGGKPHKSTQTP